MFDFGIDIGGTNISAGIVTKDHKIIAKDSMPTYKFKNKEDLCDKIINLYYSILKENKVKSNTVDTVGIGVPGTIDKSKNIIKFCPNINIKNWDIVTYVKNKTHKPVFIENDAMSALIGELFFIKKQNDIIMLTIGTGIGSAAIINKKIVFNTEFGHMIIHKNGRLCNCGQKGCFETYASATGLIKTAKEIIKSYPDSYIFKLSQNNIKNIKCSDIFFAKTFGDSAANNIINKYIKDLSFGILKIINNFHPKYIILGGGLSHEGNNILKLLKNQIKKTDTKIVISKFLNDSGIIGAAALATWPRKY